MHKRLLNDEKLIRRILKRYHALLSALSSPSDDVTSQTQAEELRQFIQIDLASFMLLMQKSALVDQAEMMQVAEYEANKARISASTRDHVFIMFKS